MLTLLLVYVLVLELAAQIALPYVSRERQRLVTDRQAAVFLAPTSIQRTDSILMVGNSLLLNGIDRSMFRQKLPPQYQVEFFPVENTTYLDWYFGLRRLFHDGARPSVIVLSLNVPQMLSNATNAPLFARAMMKMGDLPQVVTAADLDRMSSSDYFFTNLSEWLGVRAGVRNAILEKWLPNAGELVARFAPRAGPKTEIDDAKIQEVVERLQTLRDVCDSHGAKFAFLVPPSLDPEDPALRVARQASQTGITVLIPVLPGTLPPDSFSDGFHLNPLGAARFTGAAADTLQNSLAGNSASAGATDSAATSSSPSNTALR